MKRILPMMTLPLFCANAFADDCDEGVSAHDAMDYGEAVAAFTHCIDEAGESPALLQQRGRAHMKSGDYDAAMVDFTAAIGIDESFAPAWNSRAWVYYLQGNLGSASENIETAARLDPDNPRILDTHAHILAAQGEMEQAGTMFDKGMQQQTPQGVEKIQRKLKEAGYDPGPVDGVYGPRTRSALEACARDACNIWEQA
jgi:tetratricopeptide (TPR) repeat protein